MLPQGVSKAIKNKGGYAPFKEIAKFGPIEGGARLTSAGKLPFRAIIHVAGINMFWVASSYSIANSVIDAIKLVNENKFTSVAFPLIGSGSGNRGKKFSLKIMMETFQDLETNAEVFIVCHQRE